MRTKLTAALLLLCLSVSAFGAGITNFSCFNTVAETRARMTNLVSTYPHLARLTNVGSTKQGRQILGVVLSRISAPGPKHAKLLTGGIHAWEMSPATFLLDLAEEACAAYATNGYSYQHILDWSEIHIIPCIAIDSALLVDTNGPMIEYRTENGVNLGRNFGFTWGWGTAGTHFSTVPGDPNYYGTGPSSEPETQALTNYLRAIFPDRRAEPEAEGSPLDYEGMLVDLHTQAATITFWKAFTNAPGPNHQQMLALASKGGHYTSYSLLGNTGTAGTSGSLSQQGWGDLGVPSMTWEFGPVNGTNCSTWLGTTKAPNLNAFRYLLRVRQPYLEPSGPEVLSATASYTNGTLTIAALADDTRNGTNVNHNISTARFSLDVPPWHAGATPSGMTVTSTGTGTATLSATVSIPLSDGEHLVYIDATDANAETGAVSSALFTVTGSEPPPATPTDATLRVIGSAIRGIPSTWRVK